MLVSPEELEMYKKICRALSKEVRLGWAPHHRVDAMGDLTE